MQGRFVGGELIQQLTLYMAMQDDETCWVYRYNGEIGTMSSDYAGVMS